MAANRLALEEASRRLRTPLRRGIAGRVAGVPDGLRPRGLEREGGRTRFHAGRRGTWTLITRVTYTDVSTCASSCRVREGGNSRDLLLHLRERRVGAFGVRAGGNAGPRQTRGTTTAPIRSRTPRCKYGLPTDCRRRKSRARSVNGIEASDLPTGNPGRPLAERRPVRRVRNRFGRVGGAGGWEQVRRSGATTAFTHEGHRGLQDHGNTVWYRNLCGLRPVASFPELEGRDLRGYRTTVGIFFGHLRCGGLANARCGYRPTRSSESVRWLRPTSSLIATTIPPPRAIPLTS